MKRRPSRPIAWLAAAVVTLGGEARADDGWGALDAVVRAAVARARDHGLALAAAARKLSAEDLVLRAGSPVPPGLPAQRAAERESARDEAMAELAQRVAPEAPERAAWIARVVDGLDAGADRHRWIAAARVAARLGLAEALEPLGQGLAAERDATVRAAASDALLELTGRRLRTPADLAAFLRELGSEPLGSHWRRPLEEARERARQYLVAWLERDPDAALPYLRDPDPATRRAVAGVVSKLVADGRLGPEAGIRALLEQLSDETDAHVFSALLEAALDPLTGEPATAALVSDLRARLAARVAEPRPWFELPLAGALAVLPWSPGGGPDARPERGVELLVELVGGLASRGPFRDPDVVQGTLRALEGLVADGAELDPAVAARARAVAEPWLEDARAEPGVRIAALGVWTPLAGPDDAGPLLALLGDAGAPTDLRFRAIAAVAGLAKTWSTAGQEEAARPVVKAIDGVLDDPDPVLRRRALEALSDPALSASAAAVGLDHWVQRIGVEPEDDVMLGLLALVRRHGSAASVRPLLESPAFARLVKGSDGRASSTAETLVKLADGSGRLLVDVADALAAVDDPPSRQERLRGALLAVAHLSDEMARELDPAVHRRAVAWALELRQAGGELPAKAAGGGLFLRRLVEVHLEACLQAGGIEAGDCVHANALFGADLLAAEGRLDPGQVDGLFEAALAWAADHPGRISEAEIVRDRARFRALTGRAEEALVDYRHVLDLERAADADGPGVLAVRDLREALRLARGSDEPASALDFGWSLLAHPDWPAEPELDRVGDLEAVAALVEASSDSTAARQRLRSWLDEASEPESEEARARLQALREELGAVPEEPAPEEGSGKSSEGVPDTTPDKAPGKTPGENGDPADSDSQGPGGSSR